MPKPQESLTVPAMVGNLANLSSSQLLNLRETMTQCEAKEWIQRYQKKVMNQGRSEAFHWWQNTLTDIAKRRGHQAAKDLQNRMNKIKSGEKNEL